MNLSEIRVSQTKERYSKYFNARYILLNQKEKDIKWLIEEVERLNERISINIGEKLYIATLIGTINNEQGKHHTYSLDDKIKIIDLRYSIVGQPTKVIIKESILFSE